MEQKIGEFGKKLALAKNILLINHIRMDPDCFWSLAALYSILKKLNYNVVAINDEKSPVDFDFLWWEGIITPNINIKEFNPDLIISLDAASLDQLWNTYKNNKEIFEKTDFVVFDHHITNPWFGSLNIIDTQASSTCELLFRVLETIWLDIHIDAKIATFLTTWIHTDTNIFYNSNTTPQTLKTAAKLMEYWADFRAPMFHFYKKKQVKKTKLWWEVLKNLKSTENWKIVWALIPKEVFEKTNTTDKDTSWLVNEFLSNMEWMEVCFLIYYIDDSKLKTSFRSTWYDVASLCASYGWWWHKQAAWFYTELSMEEAEKEILDKLKELI